MQCDKTKRKINPPTEYKMTRVIKFTKMHGAGNDYIYVNTLKYPIESPEKLSVEWSAPHTGIGSDGLVLIGSSDKAISGYAITGMLQKFHFLHMHAPCKLWLSLIHI